MKQLLATIITIVLLVGCNNGIYEKAMEQGKLALANGEFNKALASFELALEEEPKDKEARTLYEGLVSLNQVKEAIENAKWDDALTKANSLLKDKTLESNVKKELEQYVQTAETSKAQYKTVSEKVEYIKGLVTEKKYSEAQAAIDELKQDTSLKPVFDDFSNEVNTIEQIVNTEITKQKEAEIAAAKKAEEAAMKAAEASAAAKKEEERKRTEQQKQVQGVSPQQAENIIRKALNVSSDTIVEHDHDDGPDYIIHVYDIVDDEEGGHTATWGWYGVSKQTGQWYDWMAAQ